MESRRFAVVCFCPLTRALLLCGTALTVLFCVFIAPRPATASQFCVALSGSVFPNGSGGSECKSHDAVVTADNPNPSDVSPGLHLDGLSDRITLSTNANSSLFAQPSGCCGTPYEVDATVDASWKKTVTFTGTGPDSFTTARANLRFGGFPFVSVANGFGEATISISGSLGSGLIVFNGAIDVTQCTLNSLCSGPPITTTNGLLTGYTPGVAHCDPFEENCTNPTDATLTTRGGTVPTNVALPYNLTLESSVQLSWVGGKNVDLQVSADAIHTLTFPTDGPVFDLPPGFTVNSDDGTIVNNQFVGAAVPEPSTLSALLSGFAGIGGLAWRRHRRPTQRSRRLAQDVP